MRDVANSQTCLTDKSSFQATLMAVRGLIHAFPPSDQPLPIGQGIEEYRPETVTVAMERDEFNAVGRRSSARSGA